jgi:hypothetical protein
MFINDDRTTVTLRREEVLRAVMLSVARGLRRQRADVQPELPAECPMCLGAITAELFRYPADQVRDWHECYIFECERCGFGGTEPVVWPEDRGLSLRQYLWGPLVDVDGTEAGSWDAQRYARKHEERPDFDPLRAIHQLAREQRIDVGVVLTEAWMAGLIEDTGDITMPEFRRTEHALSLLEDEERGAS